MKWDLKADRPIYAQLVEQITCAIVTGEYPAGGKLPSVRDLAEDAAVNPNTMQKALAELERQSLVYTQRTSGRTVTEDGARIEQVKAQLAASRVGEFLSQMRAIGVTRTQLVKLLQKHTEED